MEVFYASYQPSEYHYTLYYYDQAGNLVKTLPPAAVQPNFNSSYLAQVQTNRANNTDQTNGTNIESLATQYRYNTLNQIIAELSPDKRLSHNWFDRLGRLVVSQNAKQALDPSYSYTLYDALGRITEVGQKPQNTAMTQAISRDTTQLENWLADLVHGGTKAQMTRTIYDVPGSCPLGSSAVGFITQLNLRNRVSMQMVIDQDNSNCPPYRAATFYSYDIHGNADTVLQDFGPSSSISAVTGDRYKLIKYDYDLISGNVNQVSYQPGQSDGYYHQYTYDAENRLLTVKTSRDSVWWQTKATYTYYRHGPLARLLLGDPNVQGAVQGLDYAYTYRGG